MHRSIIDGLVKEASNLSAGSDRQIAEMTYAQAVTWTLETDDIRENNLVCWQGTLDGFAPTVLAACDRMVVLAPDDGAQYEPRALARALTGNLHGAADDLRHFVDWAQQRGTNDRFMRRRKGWVVELESGRNPFDASTLASLRADVPAL